MVSVSLHFALAVLVITLLCLIINCDARGIKNVAEEAGDATMMSENQYMNSKKEVFDAIPVAAEEVKGAEGISKVNGKRVSKNSGASSAGNSKPTLKRELKMESKLSSRGHVRHLKINPNGFMALNADYHMARPHPPKNN